MDHGSDRPESSSSERKTRAGNRLRFEKSPYLLQHAGNPVDWYPWSDEAFRAAAARDCPIFLSIGYSSCHWCHVMEQESFEDPEVARILNDRFVSIKVDREERPDVDAVYMRVCQGMTGSGGWPLSIVMTSEKEPFFAGTYFPPTARFGLPGFIDILNRIADLWERDRDGLLGIAAGAVVLVAGAEERRSARSLDAAVMDEAYRDIGERFDERHGGFGSAPKFPSPHLLSFLLRMWKRSGDPAALEMVETTLGAMLRGGIHDHLGHGFHRYSTDERWLVPHFEKMLYDQALLAVAYAEAHRATGKPLYADAVRGIFGYVLSRMTSEEGAFYSSEDADSEGHEGRYYTWPRDEVMRLLGARIGEIVCAFYGVTERGEIEGRSILRESAAVEELAAERGMAAEELRRLLEEGRRTLSLARRGRVAPALDDKVLTDWNGLMIAALAIGARSIGESSYADRGARAADFLLRTMRDGRGRLLHRYRDGEAAIPACLDDYAFLLWGLVELYQTTFEIRFLAAARTVAGEMIDLFADAERGGFYFTGVDGETIIARTRDIYDGAIPSGNSAASATLLRLARITGDDAFERSAAGVFQGFADAVRSAPAGFAALQSALDFALGPSREIVIAGERTEGETRRMLAMLGSAFLPRTVVVFAGEGAERSALEELVPFVARMTSVGGRATAYVCERFRCKAPVTGVGRLRMLIEEQ